MHPTPGEARADIAPFVAKDLSARRGEFLFPVPRSLGLHDLLHDPRDEPALYLVANACMLTLPAATWMLFRCSSHWLGAGYLVLNYVLMLQRFMLTLHVTQHRRLFKPGYDFLNHLAPYILAPLFGVPPGLYRPHHVVMHHVEDNRGDSDISSTERYQRDNFAHFLMYWVRYWVGAWFELPLYAAQRSRSDLLAVTLGSEAGFWLLVAALWRNNWVGTLWTLIIPFLLSSFLLMFGNWSQHVFVDPHAPHDTYRSTYNCLACPDNRLTYNDGYHVIHHLNSRAHWSELPSQFLATLDQHDAHDALTFHSIGFFDVGLAVFTGRLGYLARHILPCGPRQATRTHQDWVELLKERLRPVTAGDRPKPGSVGHTD